MSKDVEIDIPDPEAWNKFVLAADESKARFNQLFDDAKADILPGELFPAPSGEFMSGILGIFTDYKQAEADFMSTIDIRFIDEEEK